MGQVSLDQDFSRELNREIDALRSRVVFISSNGLGLNLTNDAFPILKKKGCYFEQIANYAEDGNLYVNKELYSYLDPINKIAFEFHEGAYAVARKFSTAQNSIKTRRLVALLLANESVDHGALIQELMSQLISKAPNVSRPDSGKKNNSFFEQIQSGTYGTLLESVCGIHIEKNGAHRKLVVEYVNNPLQANIECSIKGHVATFDCTSTQCVAYSNEQRTRFAVTEETVMDDGNFTRIQFNYDFSKKEYVEVSRVKFKKID